MYPDNLKLFGDSRPQILRQLSLNETVRFARHHLKQHYTVYRDGIKWRKCFSANGDFMGYDKITDIPKN